MVYSEILCSKEIVFKYFTNYSFNSDWAGLYCSGVHKVHTANIVRKPDCDLSSFYLLMTDILTMCIITASVISSPLKSGYMPGYVELS